MKNAGNEVHAYGQGLFPKKREQNEAALEEEAARLKNMPETRTTIGHPLLLRASFVRRT